MARRRPLRRLDPETERLRRRIEAALLLVVLQRDDDSPLGLADISRIAAEQATVLRA